MVLAAPCELGGVGSGWADVSADILDVAIQQTTFTGWRRKTVQEFIPFGWYTIPKNVSVGQLDVKVYNYTADLDGWTVSRLLTHCCDIVYRVVISKLQTSSLLFSFRCGSFFERS